MFRILNIDSDKLSITVSRHELDILKDLMLFFTCDSDVISKIVIAISDVIKKLDDNNLYVIKYSVDL